MSSTSPISSTALPSSGLWRTQLALVACVFLGCLAGIYSRPIGYTAAFWAANAIMLGMLLRYPALGCTKASWAGSFVAYVAADLLTGSSLAVSATLTLCNMTGVFFGWRYFSRLPGDVIRLQRQRSVLHLFMGCVVAALGCAITGGAASAWLFDVPLRRSVFMWGFSEFYSFIILLPIIVSAPKGWMWTWFQGFRLRKITVLNSLPLISLVLSEVLTFYLAGPGSLGFVMPSMVWCAMAYGVFPTTLLSFVVGAWKTATIAMGVFEFTHEHVFDVVSFRTGTAMLTLAPLAVACAYGLRTQALEKLNHAVNHDFLTGALARRALMERGTRVLTRMQVSSEPMAVLMMDLDFFKKINDNYGHAQGDVVLQYFVELAHKHLRPDDLLGRMGGEEFAIILPRTAREQALAIGQRLCEQVRHHPFPLGADQTMQVTISAGLYAVERVAVGETLEQLLMKADEALYAAKSAGRNQVRQWAQHMQGAGA